MASVSTESAQDNTLPQRFDGDGEWTIHGLSLPRPNNSLIIQPQDEIEIYTCWRYDRASPRLNPVAIAAITPNSR